MYAYIVVQVINNQIIELKIMQMDTESTCLEELYIPFEDWGCL